LVHISKKMKHLTLFLALTALSLTSCQREKVWVKYLETQCADPWGGYTQPDAEKTAAIKAYFSGQGVEVFHVTMEALHGPDACMACECLSGNVISCRVSEKDLPVMLDHGFTSD